MESKRTFAVGRLTGRSRTVVVLCESPELMPGPWTVCAVVSEN